MQLKDFRNRINKKIDENYKSRQKILTRIKGYLNIDFNKIAIYRSEINIKSPTGSNHTTKKEDDKDSTFFRIEMPGSLIANSRFYYKGIDIDSLSLTELKNLEKNLEYILIEIEKKTDEAIV
jgi:hypothetical protein